MCNMTHLHVRHDSFLCATWLIYTCTMTHLYMWRDSFIWIWLTTLRNGVCAHVSSCKSGGKKYVTRMNESCHTYEWLMPCMNDVTHIVKQSLTHVVKQSLIRMCDMTHSYVIHTHALYELWHTYVETDFVYMSAVANQGEETCHTYEWVTSHMNQSWHVCVMSQT